MLPDPTTRASVIESWSKAIRAHPGGAPDGTGTRTAYLLSPSVLPLLALLLDSIRRGVISPAHRRLLTTKTTSGQCKQLSDGTYPTSVAQIEAVRPLCRHSVLRRHLARRIARLVTRHRRSRLESLGQFGTSPAPPPPGPSHSGGGGRSHSEQRRVEGMGGAGGRRGGGGRSGGGGGGEGGVGGSHGDAKEAWRL